LDYPDTALSDFSVGFRDWARSVIPSCFRFPRMPQTPNFHSAVYWRAKAEEVLSRAETFQNAEARASLLVIAKSYLVLADSIDRQEQSKSPCQ